MQIFSSDSLLNSMQNLPVIPTESEEEFDLSPSSVDSDVNINDYSYILEIISDFRSDPFTLIDLELSANSYRIECTKIQNFEEGENCAYTISVQHTLGSDMKLFGFDMILFYLIFKFQ